MRYHVHLFPVVRVKVPNIEADSPEQAIAEAEDQVDFYRLLDQTTPYEQDWPEEIAYYLVDPLVPGDEEEVNYDANQWYLATDNYVVGHYLLPLQQAHRGGDPVAILAAVSEIMRQPEPTYPPENDRAPSKDLTNRP